MFSFLSLEKSKFELGKIRLMDTPLVSPSRVGSARVAKNYPAFFARTVPPCCQTAHCED